MVPVWDFQEFPESPEEMPQVVGEASNGREGVDLALELGPDVVNGP